MPLLRRLPKFLTHPWIDMVGGDWCWQVRYTPFSSAIMNADTFLIVSPSKIVLSTADAEVINQITTRRNDFPKPIVLYKMLDLYGKNVVTVEGAEWRRQRKITAAQFNEKSNALVWSESVFQAGEMIHHWTQNNESEKANTTGASVVSELGKDAMRLSLHVISRAGFGVRCLWPGANTSEQGEQDESSMDSNIIPKG
jgi:cytochrome P450